MKSTESLDILFIHKDPCVRAEKEAYALSRRGHRVHLFCEALTFQPDMRQIAKTIHFYRDLDELAALIRARRHCQQIIHCHNEPNEPTAVALDHAAGPVVYDCHDFRGLRQRLEGQEALTERRCFEETGAVIHVSQGMDEMAASRYAVRRSLVLPSFPVLDSAPARRRAKLPGIHLAYVGGLRDKGAGHYEYRNYLPFFQALVREGVHVHAYPADFNPKNLATYLALDRETDYFHLHPKLPLRELLEEISQCQWGLSGFNFMDIEDENTLLFLNNALPNKLFDYLVSGVCPVVLNCETSGRYVSERGLGYHAANVEELVETVLNEQPKPPLEDLGSIDMLRRIEDLERLYLELLG